MKSNLLINGTSNQMKEYLALDLLTLKDISEQAGRPIEEAAYLESLQGASDAGALFDVRRDGKLLSYATLRDVGDGTWFVLMFVTHPDHRSKQNIGDLFSKIITHLKNVDAKKLVSNVFKVNKLSVGFHRKLGFEVTREADLGYEFTLTLSGNNAAKWQKWAQRTSAQL